MILHPNQIELMGTTVLARKYERPEKVGSIIIPESFREDQSTCLWECVRVSRRAGQYFDGQIDPDDILITPAWRGLVRTDIVDEEGREHFILNATDILKIQRWKTGQTVVKRAA